MAVIKGTTAPTKGNPRPVTKPPTAKPLVPAKPIAAKPAAPAAKPLAASPAGLGIAGAGGMNKPGGGVGPLAPIRPGVVTPAVTQGLGQVKPLPKPPGVPLGTPGTIPPALRGLNTAWQGFSGDVQTGAQDFWAQILQGISEMKGPAETNPLKRQ